MNRFTKLLEFDEQKHEYNVLGTKLPSVTEIIGPLTYTKYKIDAGVIAQAAYKGALAHGLTAAYDRGDLGDDSPIPADGAMYYKAWKDFCHDYQAEWKYIELPLACKFFAGTVDRIGIVDGYPVVVDIKTTASMDKASKIALCAQLYGYSVLCHENDIPVNASCSLGVQLKKDGTYTVHEMSKIALKYQFNPDELFDQLMYWNSLLRGGKKIDENAE